MGYFLKWMKIMLSGDAPAVEQAQARNCTGWSRLHMLSRTLVSSVQSLPRPDSEICRRTALNLWRYSSILQNAFRTEWQGGLFRECRVFSQTLDHEKQESPLLLFQPPADNDILRCRKEDRGRSKAFE